MTDSLPFADASPDAQVDDDIDYNIANTDEIPDYHARLAAMRAEKGVVVLRFGPSNGFVLLRYADALEAVSDETRFSNSEVFWPATFPFMGPNIQGYDGHEHAGKRALVSPAFRRGPFPATSSRSSGRSPRSWWTSSRTSGRWI